MLVIAREKVDVPRPWRERVRRYLLLDIAASFGRKLGPSGQDLKGMFLVPGYGPFHGLPLDDLATHALRVAPVLQRDWASPQVILRDVRWLCERGFAMAG